MDIYTAEGQRKILAQNLNHYLRHSDKSKADIARDLNVSDAIVSNWFNGKKYPRREKIQMLADYFGIKNNDLTEPNNGSYSIPYQNQAQGFSTQANTSQNDIIQGRRSTSAVPLLGNIPAGAPSLMIVDEENMGIPDDIADMFDIDKLFYLKVRGDSMDKVVPDGSFALICEGCDATDHEVVAVRVDGNDATLKRFYRTPSMIILEPDSNNPAHKAQVYHISDGINIEVLGKLVWYRPPVRKVF